MSSLGADRGRHDGITIPNIWLAVALSLVLHLLALWSWPAIAPKLALGEKEEGKSNGSLAVRLAQPASRPPSAAPAPPPVPPSQAQEAPARKLAPDRPARKSQATPRVLAQERPSPSTVTAPPAVGDLASLVEARRRARETAQPPAPASAPTPPAAPAAPTETEQERHNRVVAESLGLNRTPTFGTDKNRGGGIFQVKRMSSDSAEFAFFGWNKAIRRNSLQTIEVRRGDNATMELAVVRKMIAIIREFVTDDFTWESQRLHRDVRLSARAADNAELETFMMSEFFFEVRSRRQ